MEKKKSPSPADRVPGRPDGMDDVINKYGTYEIQPTCGMENDYPQIAQGMAKEAAKQLDQRIRPTQRDGTRL